MVVARKLRPIKDKVIYARSIFNTIMAVFNKVMFADLLDVIKPIKEYYNDTNIIIDAIMKHKIQYVNDRFVGSFNAAISKELTILGAKFDKRSKAFLIDRFKLPITVSHAIAVASLATLTMYKNVIDFLNNFDTSMLISTLNDDLNISLDRMLSDLDAQVVRTIESGLKVKVHLSSTERQQLTDNYTQNMDLAVKKFADEQVVRLRQLCEQSLFEGLGDKALVDVIQQEFNTTKNKAMFLARQETGLLVSNYRKITYQTVGVKKYQWSTSHDDRVRTMHKELDGKVFSWDDPPVTNEKGDRNHPGEDWQCRCIPIPIFEQEA